MSLKDVQKLCDEVLTESLPPGLKAAIDDALEKGGSGVEILERVRKQEGRRGPLTLAVEAYLGADQNGNLRGKNKPGSQWEGTA